MYLAGLDLLLESRGTLPDGFLVAKETVAFLYKFLQFPVATVELVQLGEQVLDQF